MGSRRNRQNRNRGGNRASRPRQEARAPYNFVPVSDNILRADNKRDQDLTRLRHDAYLPGFHSGYFRVTLTTQTPLFIRGMLKAQQSRENKSSKSDKKHENPNFFMVDGKPCIPGSSLRGMLRHMVEIITHAKLQPVSDQAITFRAVAAKRDDPLGQSYKRAFGNPNQNTHTGVNVKSGYLAKRGDRWFIRPARKMNGEILALVPDRREVTEGVQGLKHFNHPNYQVQHHEVRYEQGKKGITRVYTPSGDQQPTAMLVCTGNMLETDQGKTKSPRKKYALVGLVDDKAKPLPISDAVVWGYRDSLTPFLQEKPFDSELGILKKGNPVFYLTDDRGQVSMFGHTPNFRMAHSTRSQEDGRPRPITPQDRVPPAHHNEQVMDYAEALFGVVRQQKVEDGASQAIAGRVSVTSATVVKNEAYEDEFTPKILNSPKPTTFQHYLEQPDGVDTPKPDLYHYGKKDARLRGHKLYWRQKVRATDVHADPARVKKSPKVYTRIRPIREHTTFEFKVHFDNLSDIELGILAWALTFGDDPNACHMLGMGKPYGLGVVKLRAQLHRCDRQARYRTLFGADGNWSTGYTPETPEDYGQYIEAFKAVMHDQFQQPFDDQPHIQALLHMAQLGSG